jgi:hypothetical protein
VTTRRLKGDQSQSPYFPFELKLSDYRILSFFLLFELITRDFIFIKAATSTQAGVACKHASMGYGPLDDHLTID